MEQKQEFMPRWIPKTRADDIDDWRPQKFPQIFDISMMDDSLEDSNRIDSE